MSPKKKVSQNKLIFKAQASLPKDALVIIFDLEGFSRFFSQPDVEEYVVKYLNYVFDAIDIVINGGVPYWMSEEKDRLTITPGFAKPTHAKFLGDGALYVWIFKRGEKAKKAKEILYLINRFWNLKISFNNVVKKALEQVPVANLPKKIRFGFASGPVYKLTHKRKKDYEYIGYCINLASRLQSYCREFGFICSARIDMPEKLMKENNYIKVIAKNLPGFNEEIVIVDSREYKGLPEPRQQELFDELV